MGIRAAQETQPVRELARCWLAIAIGSCLAALGDGQSASASA
jgi:hypothetical protein